MATNPFAFIDPWEISRSIDERIRDDEKFEAAMRRVALDEQRMMNAEERAQRQLAMNEKAFERQLAEDEFRKQKREAAFEIAGMGDDVAALRNVAFDPTASPVKRALATDRLRALQPIRDVAELTNLASQGDWAELLKIAKDPEERPERRIGAQRAYSAVVLRNLRAALATNDPEAIAANAGRLPGNPFGVVVDATGRASFARPVTREQILATIKGYEDQLIAAEQAQKLLQERMAAVPSVVAPTVATDEAMTEPSMTNEQQQAALLAQYDQLRKQLAFYREQMAKEIEAATKAGESDETIAKIKEQYQMMIERANTALARTANGIVQLDDSMQNAGKYRPREAEELARRFTAPARGVQPRQKQKQQEAAMPELGGIGQIVAP